MYLEYTLQTCNFQMLAFCFSGDSIDISFKIVVGDPSKPSGSKFVTVLGRFYPTEYPSC